MPPEASSRPPRTSRARRKEHDMTTVEYVDAGDGHRPRHSERQDRGRRRAAGGRGRHLRAHSQRPLGAAELAHLLRRLRRAALQPAGPDQHGERQADRPRLGLPGRHERPASRARRPTSFEAAPIVVDGIMFVSGWDGWVWALDARRRASSSGGTGTRSPSTCRCAAAT